MSVSKQTAVPAVTEVSAVVTRVCVPSVFPVPAARAVGFGGLSEWTRGERAAAAVAGYFREGRDRTDALSTADIAATGGLAGTNADNAALRISGINHNWTFRGRPRGRPV